MAYKVSYSTRFAKDMKSFKNDKPIKNLIQEKVKEVVQNPHLGTGYSKELSGHLKVVFGDRPAYRLIFRLYKCCNMPEDMVHCSQSDPNIIPPDCQGLIDFIHIRTREECNNLYKQDKHYFDETLLDGFDLDAY